MDCLVYVIQSVLVSVLDLCFAHTTPDLVLKSKSAVSDLQTAEVAKLEAERAAEEPVRSHHRP